MRGVRTAGDHHPSQREVKGLAAAGILGGLCPAPHKCVVPMPMPPPPQVPGTPSSRASEEGAAELRAGHGVTATFANLTPWPSSAPLGSLVQMSPSGWRHNCPPSPASHGGAARAAAGVQKIHSSPKSTQPSPCEQAAPARGGGCCRTQQPGDRFFFSRKPEN